MAREEEWDVIAQSVLDGRILPSAAEQWAAAEGLPPFVPPLPDLAGAFAWPQHIADLTLDLALAWLAFRDIPRAAWAHERRWTWGKAVDRDPPAAGQILDRTGAERQLWEALRLGRIQAIGRRPSIDPLRDPGPLVAIAADDWRNLPALHDGQSGMVGPDANRWSFAEVAVPRFRVFELWPSITAQEIRPGRPSLEHLWRPEFERRAASGDQSGATAMGQSLAEYLAEETRSGRLPNPDNIPIPQAASIARAITRGKNKDAPHV